MEVEHGKDRTVSQESENNASGVSQQIRGYAERDLTVGERCDATRGREALKNVGDLWLHGGRVAQGG